MNPEVLTAKKWYRWLWFSPFLTIPSLPFLYFFGNQLICQGGWQDCNHKLADGVSILIALLGSALWHLILLKPALDKESEFIRWHGRQALFLAGIRSAVPFPLFIIDFATGGYGDEALRSIPILIAVWLFGTSWGQRQAKRGDCALMRWTGHGAALPLAVEVGTPLSALDPDLPGAEQQNYRASYRQAVKLLRKGQPEKAARIFHKLLVSDASPESKAKVAKGLKLIGKEENLADNTLVAIFRFSQDPEQKEMALTELRRQGLVEAM